MHLCTILLPSARLGTGRALQLTQGRTLTRRLLSTSSQSVESQQNSWEWEIRESLGSAAAFAVLFEAPMLGGRCVGVKLPTPLLASSPSLPQVEFSGSIGAPDASTNLQGMTAALWAELHPQEAALARSLLAPEVGSAGAISDSKSEVVDSTVVAHVHRFCGGRLAARRALAAAMVPIGLEQAQARAAALGPVMKGARGEPVFQGLLQEGAALGSNTATSTSFNPSGQASVSISHKDDVAVALVQTVERQQPEEQSLMRASYIGIDIEDLRGRRGRKADSSNSSGSSSSSIDSSSSSSSSQSTETSNNGTIDQSSRLNVLSKRAQRLAKRVLTAREHVRLGELASCGLSMDDEVLVIFSFKEAAYKAMDPILRRFVGWQEVEASPSADGTATLTFIGKQKEAAFAHAKDGDSNICSSNSSSNSSNDIDADSDEDVDEPRLELVGQWRRVGDFVVTACEASRRTT